MFWCSNQTCFFFKTVKAKSRWWVQLQDKTAIILTTFIQAQPLKKLGTFFMFFCLFRYSFTKSKEICKIKFPLFAKTNLKVLNVVLVIKMDITLWTRITMQSARFVQQEVQQRIILLRWQIVIHLIQRFWMFEFYATTVS